MYSVKFKYFEESRVYPKLIDAVNKLCTDKNKNCLCTSGYRSLPRQKIINAQVLKERKGAYQNKDGSVYTPDGKCWASAYGDSRHCYGMALDIDDGWFKALTNAELKKYGLIKPMSHEPWHVELIELRSITGDNRKVFYFQYTHGLTADGICGPKTKSKMKEVGVKLL